MSAMELASELGHQVIEALHFTEIIRVLSPQWPNGRDSQGSYKSRY